MANHLKIQEFNFVNLYHLGFRWLPSFEYRAHWADLSPEEFYLKLTFILCFFYQIAARPTMMHYDESKDAS